jgi:hypothetical protein
MQEHQRPSLDIQFRRSVCTQRALSAKLRNHMSLQARLDESLE